MAAADPAPPFRRLVGPLLGAAHPGPSLLVTTVAAALAWGVGRTAAGVVAVAAAVLSGQLAIGWTNDAADADRDARAGRRDKPVVTGTVARGTVRRAAVAAGAACVPLSLLSGLAAGSVHLVSVGCGLAYDLRLKATAWSWLPFAVAFGLLPAFVTLGLPGRPWPPAWVTVTAALLGVGAHLVNALPDLDDDVALGVRGLPQRLGAVRTRAAAAGIVLAATVTLALGPADRSGPVGLLLGAVGVVVVWLAVGRSWPAGSRAPFTLVAGLALFDVVVLVARVAGLS
jgi:4-hydroxybenzoate polyprenyltransferase